MKPRRWTALFLAAFVGLFGHRADALYTLPAVVIDDLTVERVDTFLRDAESACQLAELHPLVQNDDDECIDLFVFVEPETHTRVLCIVQSPLGLRAYGNDFIGPIDDRWDWRVNNYTQDEVDAVYIELARRDRHVYSPGLANPEAYQAQNEELLERILGVPVRRARNGSMNQLGENLKGSNNWLIENVGKPIAGAGTLFDWGYAVVNKVPVLRYIDPATRRAIDIYDQSFAEVQQTGGRLFAWMHSEGAIHGSIWIKETVTRRNRDFFVGYALGPGTGSFGRHATVERYWNVGEGRFLLGLFRDDPVVRVAGGGWYSKDDYERVRDVTQTVIPGHQEAWDENYVHGFPTYAEHVIVDLAMRYFQEAAFAIYGR